MKTKKSLITLLIVCFSFLNVFSQTNPVLNYLPENFQTVIKINPVNLLLKVKWADLAKSKMFEGMMKDFPQNGKQSLGNPLQWGIDFGKGVFLVNFGNSNENKIDPAFYAVPADASQITAMVKKIFPDKTPVKSGENNLLVDKHTALIWNNEIVILTGDDAKKDSVELTDAEESLRIKQLTDRCIALINKHEPLQNEYLLSLVTDQSDLSICTNNSVQSGSNKKKSSLLNMFGQNTISKGSYTAVSVNFEKGKVVAETKQYINPTTDSLFKKYVSSNINTELIKKLPTDHPIVLCSFSLPVDLIKQALNKASSEKGTSDADMEKMNDMFSSINGDLMIAIMSASDMSPEDSVTKSMGGMEVFIAGNIRDKEKFKSLNSLLRDKSQDQSSKNPLGKMKPAVFSNDSYFVISLSPYLGQKFLTASDNSEISTLIEPYKNYSSFFMVDLKAVFGFLMQTFAKGKSEEDIRQSAAVLGLFDKLIAYSNSHTDKYIATTAEITMTNKDENSLMQFINLIDVIYSMKSKAPKKVI